MWKKKSKNLLFLKNVINYYRYSRLILTRTSLWCTSKIISYYIIFCLAGYLLRKPQCKMGWYNWLGRSQETLQRGSCLPNKGNLKDWVYCTYYHSLFLMLPITTSKLLLDGVLNQSVIANIFDDMWCVLKLHVTSIECNSGLF